VDGAHVQVAQSFVPPHSGGLADEPAGAGRDGDLISPSMETADNDFLYVERPKPFDAWPLRHRCAVAARFWDAVGSQIDGALIRTVGPARWASFYEELFRVHQRDFFLSGCERLGIADVAPDPKKCVLYHCMSTTLGGVRSRYAIESDAKAWVFYLPDTMLAGGGTHGEEGPIAAFRGWYANNGPALGNDRLAFVLTHLVSRGDPYEAGYFIDTGAPVAPEERLQFDWGAQPPPLAARKRATFDPGTWPEERRLKALRNFAVHWAWDRVGGAVSLIGEPAVSAVGLAFEIVVAAFLPYFETALGGSGASLAGRYFAAVHEIAGVPATVSEDGSEVQVELARDPMAHSSFQVAEETRAATYASIRDAWAGVLSDYGVAIESIGPTDLRFTGAGAASTAPLGAG
jgi:hypothetical protein